MVASRDLLRRYIDAHREEFGEDISEEEAMDDLNRLVSVLRALAHS